MYIFVEHFACLITQGKYTQHGVFQYMYTNKHTIN